jgi:single-strand DNA-binding protein
MAADNHTTIVGNLVDDPELRFTASGIAVANLRVAVTQRIQQDDQWRDGDTSFLRVNAWRDQAEHLADSLGKGDRVMVTGRLRQRSWETPQGEKRSVTEIEADEVGASLKWATAKVERASQRGNGDRNQGRERQAERGATSTTHPHSEQPPRRRPRLQPSALPLERPRRWSPDHATLPSRPPTKRARALDPKPATGDAMPVQEGPTWGLRGGDRTGDLPITSRMLGVDLDGFRRI